MGGNPPADAMSGAALLAGLDVYKRQAGLLMLLDYGVTTVWPEWFVTENKPCGFCRVYYVCGGSVRCITGEETFALQTKTLYLFPSAAPYRLEQDCDNPLQCTFLHLDLLPRVVRSCITIPVGESGTLFYLLRTIRSAIIHNNSRCVSTVSYTHLMTRNPIRLRIL